MTGTSSERRAPGVLVALALALACALGAATPAWAAAPPGAITSAVGLAMAIAPSNGSYDTDSLEVTGNTVRLLEDINRGSEDDSGDIVLGATPLDLTLDLGQYGLELGSSSDGKGGSWNNEIVMFDGANLTLAGTSQGTLSANGDYPTVQIYGGGSFTLDGPNLINNKKGAAGTGGVTGAAFGTNDSDGYRGTLPLSINLLSGKIEGTQGVNLAYTGGPTTLDVSCTVTGTVGAGIIAPGLRGGDPIDNRAAINVHEGALISSEGSNEQAGEAAGLVVAGIVLNSHSTLTMDGGSVDVTGKNIYGVLVNTSPISGAAFTMTGGEVKSTGEAGAANFGVYAYNGDVNISGGTVEGTEVGVVVGPYIPPEGDPPEGDPASSTVTISGDGTKVTGRYGAMAYKGGVLDLKGGCIEGSTAGVGLNGSDPVGSTIRMSGGEVAGGTAGMYLPSSSDQSTVSITGGTVEGAGTPSAGIVNVGSLLTVGGSASVSGKPGAEGQTISIGDAKNTDKSPVKYTPAGITSATPAGGYSQTTSTTVDGGTVQGGIANGLPAQPNGATNAGADAPQLTVSGSANVQGDVTNQGSGSADLQGGTIDGNVVNDAKPKGGAQGSGTMTIGDQTTGTGPTITGGVSSSTEEGAGSTTIYGGKVDGEVSGGVANQTPPPVEEQGTQGAVDQQVSGAVGPVESLMAGSATVTPSDDNSIWTVEITDGSMPVGDVAQNLVYQVVSALLRAGADPVASVQDPNLAVEPGDDYQQVLGFCEAVLNNSVASSSSLPAGATLSDLAGMECGVVATLADASTMSYTFEFTGSSEPGPNPPTQQVLPVYRLYNRFDHLHLYTTDANEVATLRSVGWDVDFDGEPAWYAPTPGGQYADYEVVRLYNPNNGGHYFVRADDSYQISVLTGLGWQQEGSGASIWSAAPTTSDVQVYTLFNRFNLADTHLYTASQTEVDSLVGPDAWEEQASVLWGVPQPLT